MSELFVLDIRSEALLRKARSANVSTQLIASILHAIYVHTGISEYIDILQTLQTPPNPVVPENLEYTDFYSMYFVNECIKSGLLFVSSNKLWLAKTTLRILECASKAK